MIGYYSLSIIGKSHQKKEGSVCQDAHCVKLLENGWVVAAIADGLGSASHSDVGSSIAVETVVKIVDESLPPEWNTEKVISLLRSAYDEALKLIKQKSIEDANSIRDYDTTLTTIIYNGVEVVFAHVGDGGIITLNNFGYFKIITTVQKGDAFNEVVPLRAGQDAWAFGSTSDPICAVLMLTDGIYDVACPPIISKTEQPIRINYVRQFMDRNKLQVNTVYDFVQLNRKVQQFYEGPGSDIITDDKTIVGIINTDIIPDVREEGYYLEPDIKALVEEQRRRLYNMKYEPDSEISEDRCALTKNGGLDANDQKSCPSDMIDDTHNNKQETIVLSTVVNTAKNGKNKIFKSILNIKESLFEDN